MQSIRGKIQKDGMIIIDDIEIVLRVDNTGIHPSWSGHFDLEVPNLGMLSQNFQIILQDGREGDIIVDDIYMENGSIPRIIFQGTGPLQ